MKHIIILRHAKSNWNVNYDGDINRPITSKAIKRAKKTGELLKQKNLVIDLALVSASVRTQQTFKSFCDGFAQAINHQTKNEIYHGDLKTLLSLVQNLNDGIQTVMLVGHEPTCSFFTEQLLKKVNQEIIFKTATIAKIDFEQESWKDINWLMGSLDWIERAET